MCTVFYIYSSIFLYFLLGKRIQNLERNPLPMFECPKSLLGPQSPIQRFFFLKPNIYSNFLLTLTQIRMRRRVRLFWQHWENGALIRGIFYLCDALVLNCNTVIAKTFIEKFKMGSHKMHRFILISQPLKKLQKNKTKEVTGQRFCNQ